MTGLNLLLSKNLQNQQRLVLISCSIHQFLLKLINEPMNRYPAKFYHFYRHVQIHVWNTLTALNAWDLGRVHSATKCAKKDARTSKLLIFCMMKVINQI